MPSDNSPLPHKEAPCTNGHSIDSRNYIKVPLSDDIPKNTDYIVCITDDSMEPYIHNGGKAFVIRTNDLSPGDIGLFFVDSELKCMQYCEDSYGNIYLFSLNRTQADSDMFIPHTSEKCIYCFGKVILSKQPSLPGR